LDIDNAIFSDPSTNSNKTKMVKVVYFVFVFGSFLYFLATFFLYDILIMLDANHWRYLNVSDVMRDKLMIFIFGHQLVSLWVLLISYFIYAVLTYKLVFDVKREYSVLWPNIFIVVAFFVCINYSEVVIFRRLTVFILLLPFCIFAIIKINEYFSSKKAEVFGLKKVWLFLFIIIALIPGFYFPPFYDGIAGWSMEVDPKYSQVKDWKIEFDDGSREWYRPSFFNPITMRLRVYKNHKFHLDRDAMEREFPRLLYCLYVKAFSDMNNGYLPTQTFFGRFSYPPHTLDAFPKRSKYLSPDRIKKFVFVKYEIRDREIMEFEELDELSLLPNHKTCN